MISIYCVGGELRHTATMRFDTGEEVTITQQFTGQDSDRAAENGLTTIEGTAPNLPIGAQVTVGSHSEVYTKYQPGKRVEYIVLPLKRVDSWG